MQRIDHDCQQKKGIKYLLLLIMLTACTVFAGCASSSGVIADSVQPEKKWHGLTIADLADKLPTPDSVTELAGGGKTYRWSRTETVETLSYSNYKRSVQATCIFQVTTAADTTVKTVTNRGHEQVCQYFTDSL